MPLPLTEMGLCLLLAWASACDLRTRTVPNACSVGGAAVMAGVSVVSGSPEALMWMAAIAGPLAIVSVARPAALGMGDVKVAALIAAAEGRVALLGLAIGFALALSWAARGLKEAAPGQLRGVTVALAPWLSLGAAAAVGLVG